MRLLAQVASRFLVILGLLVFTDRSLLGMYLAYGLARSIR
jgi:hypothetical protein